MDKSLFDVACLDEFNNRINKLSQSSQAQWGKMDVAQMLNHCCRPLKIYFGEAQGKRGIFSLMFGAYFKKNMVNYKPFQRNLPTDKTFKVNDPRKFEEERNRLMETISRFSKGGPKAIKSSEHPFFGKMNAAEWDILTCKHLDHHLRQFGA